MKSSMQLFLLIILCAVQFSCKNDSDKLIGEWLRSDFNTNFEYTLSFEENNAGYIANRKITEDGVISNAVSMDWNVNNNVLIISQEDEDIVTTFEFTSNGNLILADFSTFNFIKQE